MPLDGITLAVGQWPGPDTAERTVVAIHGLTANHVCWPSLADMAAAIVGARLVTVADHSTVLLGEAPQLKAALPAFLAGE